MSLLRFALLALLVVSVSACDSNDPSDDAPSVLYVGNSGNFSDNNGSLTRYDLDTGVATADAVPNLGGLVQNLYSVDGELYVLLNFSDSFSSGRGRIDVVNAASGVRARQIDVRTPRALALNATGTQSYVTNLYDDTVTPVDLATGVVGTPLDVGGTPEGAVAVGGRTYVANSGFGSGTSVSVITGGVVSTIEDVCTGPRTLLADRDTEVWVICTGASDFSTGAVTAPGEVVVLDGATGMVRQRVTFEGETLGSATFGQDGSVTADGSEIYVIAGDGVIRFDTRSNAQTARLAVSGAPIGAVAYDTATNRLYLGRPDADNPFTVDGVVTVHSRDGVEVSRFAAGIAPASLVFATTPDRVEV